MIRPHHHLIADILHFLVGGGLGLVSASLAHQCGWRLADRMPGESRWPSCAYCLKPFTWQAIFPLFGWLLRPDTLALRCPCGQRQNQWSQPAAEMLGFVLGLTASYLAGWSPMVLPLTLGLGLLPAIALIDLHFGIIPDELNVLIVLFGVWWLAIGGGDFYIGLMVAAAMLALGLFCAFVYSRWRGKEMLGLGDVKFFAAAGLWLQPHNAPWFLALAGFVGAAVGLAWKRISGHDESPFAPALCLSLALCILYQLTRMP
jgi:leader peptidase (prepilin peptidase)/N-methyltransferase